MEIINQLKRIDRWTLNIIKTTKGNYRLMLINGDRFSPVLLNPVGDFITVVLDYYFSHEKFKSYIEEHKMELYLTLEYYKYKDLYRNEFSSMGRAKIYAKRISHIELILKRTTYLKEIDKKC